jgi:hypothetical protein
MFHPHERAFWEPVGAAVCAFVIGGLFGLGLGWFVNAVDPVPGAIVWGSACASLVWSVDHYLWMLIVARSYAAQPAPVVIEPEPEIQPIDTGRYTVERMDNTGLWVIDPGCSIEQLSRFAQAIVHERASTTYGDMVIARRIFQQAEYHEFLRWFVSQRFGLPDGSKGEVKITELGIDFVKSVFSRGIQYYSPLER